MNDLIAIEGLWMAYMASERYSSYSIRSTQRRSVDSLLAIDGLLKSVEDLVALKACGRYFMSRGPVESMCKVLFL